MIFYRVKTIERFIPLDMGEKDSIVYAILSKEEYGARPRNTVETTGDYRITETYFDNYEKAVAYADLMEPCYPHIRRPA